MTFRLVVAPFRGPGQSPVLPFACCVGSLLSVGRCGRCSCWPRTPPQLGASAGPCRLPNVGVRASAEEARAGAWHDRNKGLHLRDLGIREIATINQQPHTGVPGCLAHPVGLMLLEMGEHRLVAVGGGEGDAVLGLIPDAPILQERGKGGV